MASIATSTHLPVLGEPHERDEIGRELENTLHELVDLSLIGEAIALDCGRPAVSAASPVPG
jgi:hypothetical protein